MTIGLSSAKTRLQRLGLALVAGMVGHSDRRMLCGKPVGDCERSIGGTIVHDDDFTGI